MVSFSQFSEIMSQILPIVFVIVGFALIWAVVELALTIRKTRGTVDSVTKQVEPTLANVETITTQIQPVIAKADPLVDRVTLTIDAANLELVRIDKILEDVGDITDTASNASNVIDGVANAPRNLVTNASNVVHRAFNNGGASTESKRLGRKKARSAKVNVDVEVAGHAASAAASIEARAANAVIPEEPAAKAEETAAKAAEVVEEAVEAVEATEAAVVEAVEETAAKVEAAAAEVAAEEEDEAVDAAILAAALVATTA